MKRTTYILIALVTTGIAAAFICPFIFLLLLRSNPSPLGRTSGKTITTETPMFSRLVVKRIDKSQIYTELQLDILADSTIQAPQFTMTGGWSEWAEINASDGTLTVSLTVPEIEALEDGSRYWSSTDLPATLRIPSASQLHEVTVGEMGRNTLSLHGIASESVSIAGIYYLHLDSCRITALTTEARYCWDGRFTAKASPMRRVNLLFNDSHSYTFDNLDSSPVDTLVLQPENSNNNISLTNARIGTLLMRPTNDSGKVDVDLGAETLTGALTK